MRLGKITIVSLATAVCGLLAQSLSAQSWSLPQGLKVKDSGPRTYLFSVTYNTANSKGEIVRRQRLTGEYTRGLGSGDVVWKNVAEADADGATAPFAPETKRAFMEGFRYHDNLVGTMKPDFFKGFPPTAVFERNLVWDTGMIEHFGQDFFDRLRLNEPYQFASDQDVNMPGVGTFRNHEIVLEWIGRSERNGQDCALIRYQAFFNPLTIVNAGMSLNGRSDYWGMIWVSLATKQVENATIYENVQGELKLTGQEATQGISVFRMGSFEPVSK
jgi:hypothetical protein